MNKIILASRFAAEAHRGQFRKGKVTAYISHPMTVALLLQKAGADEDVVVAGILHDTIEDTDVSYEDIEKEFGKNVAEMVNHVTEQNKGKPWAERKQLALEHVAEMSEGAVMVKSADVLHNMTEQLEDYKIDGENFFEKFNAGKEQQLERYEKLVQALEARWSENPLLNDLIVVFYDLKEEWK